MTNQHGATEELPVHAAPLFKHQTLGQSSAVCVVRFQRTSRLAQGLSALSRKRTIETQPPNVVPQAGFLFVCIDFGVAIQRGGTGR
jgi:hypothetical protein